MNPNTDPLFAGLSGARLRVQEFEVGEGIVLSQTFAHLMAPLLMAFAPAEPGKPHPGPWSAVKGGLGCDIHVQLYVPAEFSLPSWFDRLNTVWWFAALIRLRTSPAVAIPAITNRPLKEIPEHRRDVEILPIEVNPQRMLSAHEQCTDLADGDLDWIRRRWVQGGQLMNRHADFNTAFQAFDSSGSATTPSLALLTLWGALEQLFSPGRQELRFRVSALIASFLEPSGPGRRELYKRVAKLYDARSKVAHGTAAVGGSDLSETYHLMRRILVKMIEAGHVPSRSELEAAMFCA